jgi:tetrahydrodipicolinate N-succinyltransferase
MQVICLEGATLYALVEQVIQRLTENNTKEDKWISTEEAMKKLHITSKTTLQKLRDEGKIIFTQPEKKIILYDADSIAEYLDKHSHKTF